MMAKSFELVNKGGSASIDKIFHTAATDFYCKQEFIAFPPSQIFLNLHPHPKNRLAVIKIPHPPYPTITTKQAFKNLLLTTNPRQFLLPHLTQHPHIPTSWSQTILRMTDFADLANS